MLRPFYALYFGGMGAKGTNFHANVAIRMGYEDEVDEIQDLYLDGKKDEAAAAIPRELIEQLSLIGPKDKIRHDLDRWRESIVTTLLVAGDAATLRTAAELVLRPTGRSLRKRAVPCTVAAREEGVRSRAGSELVPQPIQRRKFRRRRLRCVSVRPRRGAHVPVRYGAGRAGGGRRGAQGQAAAEHPEGPRRHDELPRRRSPSPAARCASTGSRPQPLQLGHRADRPRRVDGHADPAQAHVPRARLPAATAPASPRRSARRRCPARRSQAEVGDTIVVHFRNARRALRPGASPCTRTACATRPTTTAPTSATSRASAASSRPARSSPTRGRRRPTRSASGPTTTTGRTTRQHRPRPLRRDRSSARRAPKRRTSRGAVPALVPAAHHRAARAFQCINGRTAAGNTPTVRAKVGQDVAWHVFGGDGIFHTFHVHGHRWKDPAAAYVDNPTSARTRLGHRPLDRGQPGPLALPLPRRPPTRTGMAGWYFVEP